MRRSLLLVSLVALSACSDPVTEPAVDRAALLDELARGVIVPAYEELATEAATLEAEADMLCATRTMDALLRTRAAWLAVRRPWRTAEAFELGPVRDLRIKNAIEFLPLREDDVEAVLAGAEPIDDAYVASLGVQARGLPVLEYLLFGDDVLASLGDASPSRRCLYIASLATDLAVQSERLAEAWRPTGGNYGATLAEMSSGGVDDLVNASIETLQLLEGERIAKPLGRRDGGTPQLDAIEVRRSGAALADLKAGLRGIEAIYTGDYAASDTRGIAALVVDSNPTLDARIRGQIATAKSALDRVPEPLSDAIVQSPEVVEEAFLALRALLRLMAADLASQLGVTTTFSDNDGD